MVVQVSPPRLGLPAKDYYDDNAVVTKYETVIEQVLQGLIPSTTSATGGSKDLAHDLVEFEKKIAAASPDAEDSDDVTVSLGFAIKRDSS